MFRAGVWAASTFNESSLTTLTDPGTRMHYETTGVRVDAQNVFVSAYGYFAGAAAVNVVCILVVLYSYHGWWTFDRNVSFSPLELAKARQTAVQTPLEIC